MPRAGARRRVMPKAVADAPADLADSRSALGDLADAVPHLVWVADADGIVTAYNRRIADYRRARSGHGDGWRWELLVHPDDLAATGLAWAEASRNGRPYEHEHRLQMADGTYRWHLSRATRVEDPVTGSVRWYGTATDIDGNRATEELLRQTQRSLALAMRGGRMGWWTRDLRTEVVTWSPELEAIFGLEAGSFGGIEASFLDLVHDDDRPRVEAAVAAALERGRDYVVTFRFRHGDGSWRWMDGRGRATYEDGRPTVLYGIGIDVTERMETESATRANEERLRLATAAAGLGLYELDFAAGTVYRSPELEAMIGRDPELGARPDLDVVHAEDRDRVDALFAASQDPTGDGSFEQEYRVLRPDGTPRWVSVLGQTFFTRPEPSPDRRPVRSVGIVQDITERKQADEIRDVFIGMLSHELRTPVTAIFGGSQLLRRDHLDAAVRDEIVHGIVEESERLERLVENLLVLARAERHVVEGGGDPVLVRPVLTRVIADKRRRWPAARIDLTVAPGLPPALWEEGSLELVVRNLISNALKYGGEDGWVGVRGYATDDGVAIAVADAGPGLPADADRLFELFYRSDEARRRAQGAGIGLFVVRALVDSAGGSVRASDRPEGGAEFVVELPAFVVDETDFD
jgi:PAS domain S-box-containing protein